MNSPTLAVIPVLVGPLQVLVALLPAIADGRLYVGMGNADYIHTAEELGKKPRGEVWCFDLATMDLLWKARTGRTVLGAVAARQRCCYAAGRDGVLCQFRTDDGKLLAKFNARASIMASPALGRRTVYVISEAGTLHGLDVNGLDPVWQCQVGTRPLFVSSPTLARGHVYVGTQADGLVCAGQPGTPEAPFWAGGPAVLGDAPLPKHGDFLWQFPDDQIGETEDVAVAAAPALIGDMAIVPLATDKRKGLACLPRAADETPAELWFYATDNKVVLPPAARGTVSGGVDRVFAVDGQAGDQGRRLHCLNGDGKMLWQRKVARRASGHVLLRKDCLIVDDRADAITCVDLDGNECWSSNVGRLAAPAICEQGMLIVATADSNHLIALDGQTGKELWRRQLDDVVTGTPVVTAGGMLVPTRRGCTPHSLVDGSTVATSLAAGVVGNLLIDGPRVWFGTADGTLHVVDAETWRPIARAQLGVNAGGLVRVRDRIVVAGDEKYYAVELNAQRNAIRTEAWHEDVSWLGQPVASLSSADGRLWVPARGWGMMCLGGTP